MVRDVNQVAGEALHGPPSGGVEQLGHEVVVSHGCEATSEYRGPFTRLSPALAGRVSVTAEAVPTPRQLSSSFKLSAGYAGILPPKRERSLRHGHPTARKAPTEIDRTPKRPHAARQAHSTDGRDIRPQRHHPAGPTTLRPSQSTSPVLTRASAAKQTHPKRELPPPLTSNSPNPHPRKVPRPPACGPRQRPRHHCRRCRT